MPLSPGVNTLTALATDQEGLTASASETITRAAVPVAETHEAPAVAATPLRASRLSTARVSGEKVAIALGCAGTAGRSCQMRLSLTTVEHLVRGRLKGLSAAAKKLTVGTSTVTIAAGSHETATIKLNAAGRKLLARFHKVPVELSAVLTGQESATFLTQNLAFKAPLAKHRG